MTVQEMSTAAETDMDRVCPGRKRHTATNQSWRDGCRHPGAIAAHKKWLKDRRPYQQHAPAVDADGNCVAGKHDSAKAWLAGCRCPESIRRREHYQARRLSAKARRRDAEQAHEWDLRAERARRLTGGRLTVDPRRHWRHGAAAVDRNNLWWLLHGVVDRPTRHERLAAVVQLTGKIVPGDAWYKKPHVITYGEIAERIGCTDQTVRRLIRERALLAGERARRRLADAQWRAAVSAAADGRAQREAARHAAAHAARRARQLFYARTRRRLERARGRARFH